MTHGIPIYLRDLSEECQTDWVERFNNIQTADYADGKDLIVGYYVDISEVKADE